ncbi:conserved hypothetical protein [Histoplasma capsulatum G186AR]|uniref:Protein kinase domain-containing protein n=2 Tax=Ajellomyces capsulatus TaxID=5037 RepID=C0NZP7_AJECG|nr:uncharacterized protein HCBG_08627 [Histoplasma capsulatum G186AR]EEH03295.1 conserved hypothetical protein [Histoplasma capsulatum G186AR]KAG5290299.1 hypothetical protein I7I52_07278 [Histoplasma capsulatum]QSS72226.1 hypothetical protein I7I50_00009 [Histoplasma capsulatum G186AR]
MTIGRAGSIYQEETEFNKDLKIEIDPLKTKFIRELNASETSSIFHINYNGKPRVLKVFHNNGDPGYAGDGVRDLNRSRCEIRAYCNLERFGISDGGYVPKFYGFMLSLNPTSFAPHLDAFQRDDGLPSAILIEYLPSPLMMNCVTYSKERMNKAIIGIQQIHSALVEHNDTYPKNILIIPGDPERVVWIDFDVAITYPSNTYIGDRERGWIKEETECVKGFGVKLADDQKKGLRPNTKYY